MNIFFKHTTLLPTLATLYVICTLLFTQRTIRLRQPLVPVTEMLETRHVRTHHTVNQCCSMPLITTKQCSPVETKQLIPEEVKQPLKQLLKEPMLRKRLVKIVSHSNRPFRDTLLRFFYNQQKVGEKFPCCCILETTY